MKSVSEKAKARRKAYNAAYHLAHLDEIHARHRAYKAAHKAEIKAYNATYKAYYMPRNREKIKAAKAAYQIAHRAEIKARRAAYYQAHKVEISAGYADYRKKYYAANREKSNARGRAYRKAHPGYDGRYKQRRRLLDPKFKLVANLRTRIFHALQRGSSRSAHTMELLGCTVTQWRAHLESQFRPGMTWENYGPVWHVDHKTPCAKFDLTDPAQQRVCFHYTNTQPLFAEENLRKSAKLSQPTTPESHEQPTHKVSFSTLAKAETGSPVHSGRVENY